MTEDEELLNEMFDKREALEDASSPGEIRAMFDSNSTHIDRLVRQLSGPFKEDDLSRAMDITVRLHYLWKLRSDILQKMPPR